MEKLCEKCRNAIATGYWSINSGGETVYKYLCEDCLAKLSDNSRPDDCFSLKKTNTDLKCKNCGTSFKEFEETLYLGCPECYKSFRKLLEPIIEDIQYGNVHIGKRPSVNDQTGKKLIREEAIRLKKLMTKAIKEEKYELAEQIMDKIAELETESDDDK